MNLKKAENWSKEMANIRAHLSSNLEDFAKLANNSITPSFEGAASDGVLDSLQMFTKMGLAYIDSLENVEKLLDHIAETMKKQ